ncbi:dimethylsulfonioproprionate lyase family protein [Stagnihabitans tardus]|uniref:Transcriptional regulator n=1 Tax=Stagnihabitans tardus TaxID=2699202 RepID=A0AAE5BVL9_9RHOB|nr:dimethylsulfonioproprionate lyase family protein [Stagnihabitans tardus]NBZ87363.1 transcriptional regulator [Stagnihabitans tardus]
MRDPDLQSFLALAEEALRRCTGPAATLAAEVTARWQVPGALADAPAWLPVCDQMPEAKTPLAQAFAALAPRLSWGRRATATPDQAYYDAHANTVILGPKGLERREDLWVGVTVMAPGTLYPDHDHAPAEVYIPLTAGEWWNSAMDWTDPGLEGFIYNPPGITHAMRAGTGPFLALWFLPL